MVSANVKAMTLFWLSTATIAALLTKVEHVTVAREPVAIKPSTTARAIAGIVCFMGLSLSGPRVHNRIRGVNVGGADTSVQSVRGALLNFQPRLIELEER